MEKINELNQQVEMLSRETNIVSSLASGKITSEATNENVSGTPSPQAINTINSDNDTIESHSHGLSSLRKYKQMVTYWFRLFLAIKLPKDTIQNLLHISRLKIS